MITTGTREFRKLGSAESFLSTRLSKWIHERLLGCCHPPVSFSLYSGKATLSCWIAKADSITVQCWQKAMRDQVPIISSECSTSCVCDQFEVERGALSDVTMHSGRAIDCGDRLEDHSKCSLTLPWRFGLCFGRDVTMWFDDELLQIAVAARSAVNDVEESM